MHESLLEQTQGGGRRWRDGGMEGGEKTRERERMTGRGCDAEEVRDGAWSEMSEM